MSNTTFSTICRSNTDAEFRTWGSAISTALQANGLVKTADTGQINWATVTRAAANADAGYEVYRLDDTLQATVPVFVKFYYGAHTSDAAVPRVRFEVGASSNGAGALGGLGSGTVTTLNANYGGGYDTTSRNSFVSGDGSGVAMVLWPEGNAPGSPPQWMRCLFTIDRTRNTDGTPNSSGLIVTYGLTPTPSTAIHNRVANTVTTVAYAMCWIPFPIGGGASFIDGSTNVRAFPHLVALPTVDGVQFSKMLLSYAIADLGFGATQAMAGALGATRTYKAIGSNYVGVDTFRNANVGVMMWWAD